MFRMKLSRRSQHRLPMDGIAVMALSNGYNPMDLNGLVQLNDGNWYYMETER